MRRKTLDRPCLKRRVEFKSAEYRKAFKQKERLLRSDEAGRPGTETSFARSRLFACRCMR